MLTPIDIRDKEFEKGRNYTREVREFLIKVSSEYEVIYSKNVELTDKIEQMESLLANYKNIEDTMKNALVLAQKTADSTIEAAKKEAENILINARMEANNLHVESIDKNNRIKLANKTLLDRFETYKKLCKDVLTQHLDMINLINVNFNDDDVKVDIDDVVHLTKEEINSNNEQLEQDYTGVVDKFNEVGDFSEDEINSLSEYDDYMDEDYHDDLTNYDDVYDELADIDDFTPEELAELDLLKKAMKIKLESKFFNYNISIEKDFNSLIKYIKNNYSSGIRIGIITDSNVGRIYLKEIKDNLKKYQIFTYTIIAGEKSKNIETYIDIQKFLIDNNFNRKDILISLGGGVVGDITGFCASTYMRGISFIQVPTSLLSQVDSSIGGKTAINFMALKNIIGSFYSPDYVYINLETLKTLENKELFSGYSEIIKTFLIGNIDSNDIFNFNYSIYNIDKYIFTSLLIKKRFVEKDYTDVGERLYLNFGHTFGHAIEAEYCEFLSHGECVAIGMLLAIRLSYNRGMITDQTYKRISVLINNLIFINKEIIDISRVFPNLKYDKKNFGKQKWILLKGISNPCIVTDVEEDEIIEAFKQINWCCNK